MKKRIVFIILIFVMLSSTYASAAQHTVMSGETMWAISQKYGVSLEELLAANPQINPANMQIGQTVNIPGKAAPSGRESLTYLYAGTTASYLRILNNSNGSINTVSTDYFDIKEDGSLWITPSDKISASFINEMHSRGILVTPFISNHWDKALGNTALNNREALSTQVANMIEHYNLDGINVDIENVNEQYRSAYTDFVRLLRAKIPAHKIVAVAVAANPKGWTLGWHGSYDYKALSDYSDYLMLMTYDESYQGGPAGPISSKSFFENSIQYAINQGVPKSKIVAGLPFFGRYWKDGEAIGGYGITAIDIEYLIKYYGSQVRYDKLTESANVTVTIATTDPKPTLWGGRVLSEGTYNIWYDDLNSIKYKLDTINRLGIKGAGSWALGQEDVKIWNFYASALNGYAVTEHEPTPAPEPTPTPVPTPAPTPTKTNLERILVALNDGNTRVVKSSTLLTRGEMAVLIAEMAYTVTEPNGQPFLDTANYWGAGQINALKRRGIIRGTDGLFYPNKNVTREELISVIERVLVLPNTIDYHAMTFKDVTPSMWSYSSIAKLNYFGLVQGSNKNQFRPYDTIDAATAALIFDRIEKNAYPMNPDKFLLQTNARAPRVNIKEPIINPR